MSEQKREDAIRQGARVHVDVAASWEDEPDVVCGLVVASISVHDDGRLIAWLADETGMRRGVPLDDCQLCDCGDSV